MLLNSYTESRVRKHPYYHSTDNSGLLGLTDMTVVRCSITHEIVAYLGIMQGEKVFHLKKPIPIDMLVELVEFIRGT
jgi:hypothetical protein